MKNSPEATSAPGKGHRCHIRYRAAQLNGDCLCRTLDTPRLAQALGLAPDAAALALPPWDQRPHAFSATPVFVSATQARAMTSIIHAIESVVRLPGYQEHALARTPVIARLDPGPRGVFLGYDFHLDPDGPRLIEINTNAGGALLVAALARAQRACCTEAEPFLTSSGDTGQIENGIVEMFRTEWRRGRGAQTLTRIAIVDDAPTEQYLYPEFLLFRALFERHHRSRDRGCARTRRRDGALGTTANGSTSSTTVDGFHPRARGTQRFARGPRSRRGNLDAAPARARVVRRQAQSDSSFRPGLPARAGIAATTIETLTRRQCRGRSGGCRARRLAGGPAQRYFFKPARASAARPPTAATSSPSGVVGRFSRPLRGAGDRAAERTHVAGRWRTRSAQARPPEHVYYGAIQLVPARLYQGETTNFRTAGGGFAPVVVVPENLPQPRWLSAYETRRTGRSTKPGAYGTRLSTFVALLVLLALYCRSSICGFS